MMYCIVYDMVWYFIIVLYCIVCGIWYCIIVLCCIVLWYGIVLLCCIVSYMVWYCIIVFYYCSTVLYMYGIVLLHIRRTRPILSGVHFSPNFAPWIWKSLLQHPETTSSAYMPTRLLLNHPLIPLKAFDSSNRLFWRQHGIHDVIWMTPTHNCRHCRIYL